MPVLMVACIQTSLTYHISCLNTYTQPIYVTSILWPLSSFHLIWHSVISCQVQCFRARACPGSENNWVYLWYKGKLVCNIGQWRLTQAVGDRRYLVATILRKLSFHICNNINHIGWYSYSWWSHTTDYTTNHKMKIKRHLSTSGRQAMHSEPDQLT